MASYPDVCPDLECGPNQTSKAYLLASQKQLVDSLYNLSPLLDSVLAAGLLSPDNYQEVKAEKTPKNSARKLLDIVQGQMDENGASRFIECLKECRQHYPRLRIWLNSAPDIPLGPTERQLKAQFSCLCSRLGFSLLPVSLELFSSNVLTQFELEKIQVAPTPTQQTQTLLEICLSKGEMACRSFYLALNNEDPHLVEDMNVSSLVKGLSITFDKPGSLAMSLEETRDSDGELRYSGVLKQMKTLLGVAVADEARLNVCELGVAIGLPSRTIREHLLEEVGIEDAAQLEALVTLFMEKTQDEERLLSRMAEVKIQSVRLSKRGCLLMKLLKQAEFGIQKNSSNLSSWDFLHHQPSYSHYENKCTEWIIFRFLLWDFLAEAVEKPDLNRVNTLAETLQQLQGCARVEPALLQELKQCWTDRGADNLLQSIRVLAQILRDLHPFEDCLQVLRPVQGLYSCRPSRLHRVTSFQGVSLRVIRRAMSCAQPASQDAPRVQKYKDVCVQVAQLLRTLHPEQNKTETFMYDPAKQVDLALAGLTFNSLDFDAGIYLRLMAIERFNPAESDLDLFMQLHQLTLSDLQRYLQPCDQHNFQFAPSAVQMLGPQRLISVQSSQTLIAIDNGMEEIFHFKTSDPASFLVFVHCRGYEEGKGCFEVCEPQCALTLQFDRKGFEELEKFTAEQVLGQRDDKVWIRGEQTGWLQDLKAMAKKCMGQVQDVGCCFKVTASESECKVRFTYRDGRLWAKAYTGCEVL